MLVTFIQQVINGLMLGGSYALVAIGYTLIFGVLNLLHLAHGEVAMIGSYVGLTLVLISMSQFGVLPVWVVLIAAMIGAGIVGIVVELVAFRPLGRKQLHITPLITTIAVAFMLAGGVLLYWVVGVNRKANDFFIATEGEMKKVSWSTRAEIIRSTKVVIVTVVLMAILLFVVDILFMEFFRAIGVLKGGPQFWELFGETKK